MNRFPPILLALALVPCTVAGQKPRSAEAQIALAVQAAPLDLREGATVQGYDAQGAFVVLREGGNGLVCMAPDPTAETFEVSCHHEGLEPYFARGRELRAQGMNGQDVTRTRWEEVGAGTLPLPYGGINYIRAGSGVDADGGDILDPFLRWVIYTPMATPETTGITDKPAEGAPWLMFSGTPGSHIMIVPPRGGGR
jgi:hypothetical protein